MKPFKIIFGFICLNACAFGQASQKPCSCGILLEESVQKISTIYAGFFDKVTSQTRTQYNQLARRLKSQAEKTNTERGCYEIIRQYTNWFKDEHLGIWFKVQSSADAIRTVNLNAIPKKFKPSVKNTLEGLWATADGKQQYAIIKDPLGINKFIAVTRATNDSAWKPGMLKVEFYNYDLKNNLHRGMFYQRDFSGWLNGFTLKGDKLDNWFGPSWYRLNSTGTYKEEVEDLEPVQFKVLNKDFIYLKLGRFNSGEVKKLDSLIRTNRSIIYSTPNLILDLRGNPGGDAGSSQQMIGLIYTNPVVYPPWQYRASSELIQSVEKEVEQLVKNDPYKRLKYRQAFLEQLINNPGKMVSSGDSIVRTLDSIAMFPQRVALLVDNRSGSSSEFFVFEGKQSKKVKIFGTNTAGGMDYGDVQSFTLSCGQYVLSIPWGRNGWINRFGFRIDNIGFIPDVPIPFNEKDWIKFVMNYWSR